MPSVSLADIGFAHDAEYRALALCKIVTNYYPTGRRERLKHGTVVTVDALTDPAAIRDVCAVVEMIKDHQMQFYERVALYTPHLFGFSTEHHSREDIRDYVRSLLTYMRFLRKHGEERFLPFTVPAIVKAMRRGILFPEVIPCTYPHTEIDPYEWINHRTIKLTAVAIFHGLLRWVNGRYMRPDVLVSRDTLNGTLSHWRTRMRRIRSLTLYSGLQGDG